jgi:glycosyltransferase involved in cell wall biosynthesis
MSHGTPVIVPDHGGIMEVIGQGERVGGLSFKVWDTADLARQIERLIVDDALYGSLSAAAAQIAAQFSVEAMTDQVLAHLGLPKSPP